MNQILREFSAVVWKKNSEDPGWHETVFACNSTEARALLVEKYGQEIVVSLTDVESANRPRENH